MVKSSKYCAQCQKMFTGLSKPTQCSSCLYFIHRTCTRSHASACHQVAQPVPTLSPTRSAKRPRYGASQVSLQCLSSPSPPPPEHPATSSPTSLTYTTSVPEPAPANSLSRSAIANSPSGTAPSNPPLNPTAGSPLAGSAPAETSSELAPSGNVSSLSANLISSGISTFTGYNSRQSFVPESFPMYQLTASSQQPSASLPTLTASQTTITTPAAPSRPPGAQSSATTSPLNIDAPPFTARNASRNKKKSNTLSPEMTQIEYLTTELNYTQSKIVSQDKTIKDLEHKVKILTEALKLSEEKLNSDLHKKYFGISSPKSSSAGFPHPQMQPCPCPPASYYRCPPPSCPLSYSCPCPASSENTSRVNKNVSTEQYKHQNNRVATDVASINRDLTFLKADMADLKTRLSEMESSRTKPTPRPTFEVVDPTNLDIIEVEAEIHSPEENSNNSTNTIDENVAQGFSGDPQLN